MKDSGHRLVVLTGDLNYSVRRNIADLGGKIAGLQWLVLVHKPRRTLSRLIASQRLNLRKHGWRWIPYQYSELSKRLLGIAHVCPIAGAPGGEYELDAVVAKNNIKVCEVDDIHGVEALEMVRRFAPALGLSLAAPILKGDLFNLPKLGTINLHKGRLPDFRGMPPAFWELWTGQDSVGCSVHRVNDKLDRGELLAESEVKCERYSTPRGLQIRLDELGSELVCEVAQKMLDGVLEPIKQPDREGKTWRKPSLAQELELRRRVARRMPRSQPSWKRLGKDLIARLALLWHASVGWRLATPRITVLLYHRVCDDARDNLSVGVAQFERQMQLLRQRFQVLSIEQVLASETIQRCRRPRVAVCFDDGYLDNFMNAAPILRRQGVPCSFFISTGIVGTNHSFPHDVRRGNAQLQTLNWDQLRVMHEWGFTIGSHTVSHIDCVAEAESLVREELVRSRDDLLRELGVAEPIFAYPYGGLHQMNDERRAIVRELGYQGCLAAYGGSNVGAVNRWNVLRRGIHWEFSESGFLKQCLG